MVAEPALKLPRRLQTVETVNNSLFDVVQSFGGNPYETQTIALPFTYENSMGMNLVTLNRIALSYGYVKYGLQQTVVDQPVDDAFRGGLTIESAELDQDDIKLLMRKIEECGDLTAIMQTAKWARNFGGAGLIAVTDQDPKSPMKPLEKGANLQFVAADRWELILGPFYYGGANSNMVDPQAVREMPYNYYGVTVDPSRVVRMNGRAAPSFVRQQLQGWGMSELERCMREINSYIKFQNMLFELVDEAKIDVHRIQNFNDQLATAQGTALIQLRIQLANMIKNYRNALVMDKEDEFEQKQIAFGGLADILVEFRTNLCAALKMPVNKVFGQSATGFASGEDSMENYNALVEGDVRSPVSPIVREVLKLRMQATFGYAPEDFTFAFQPLRVLNEVEEEQVKDQVQNRALALYDRDLLDGRETMESLHKDGLINVESGVLDGTREPISPLEMQAEQTEQAGKESEASIKAAAKKEKANGMARLVQLLNVRDRRAA